MKNKLSIFALAIITAFIATGLFLPGLIGAGDMEPSDPPGPTMNTLEEIYNKPVWRMFDKEFIEWANNPRFAVCDNGTPAVTSDDMVLDKETGLVWTRDANLRVSAPWVQCIQFCRNTVNIGGRKGWRLPSVEELSSLIDSKQNPPFPNGHPFINIQSENYWTNSTFEWDSQYAWRLNMLNGYTGHAEKLEWFFLWPVRGGNGYASGSW
jgi:hypothetical protein